MRGIENIMTLSVKEKKRRKILVLKYRKENLFIREIAEKSKLSKGIVGRIVKKMDDGGKISFRGNLSMKDFNSPKVQTIITMRNDGKTLREIGGNFGFTRERARQLIEYIKSRFGDVIQPNFMSVEEVAEKMGVTRVTIARWLMNIKYERKGKRYIIDEKWLSKLEEYRNDNIISRNCVVCESKMEDIAKSSTKKYCSRGCWKLARNCKNLVGWRKEVWLLLKNRKKSHNKNGEWLGIILAAKRANVSVMQLGWLSVYSIVSIKDNPDRTWRGKPAKMYSGKEMDLIRKISPTRKKRGKDE